MPTIIVSGYSNNVESFDFNTVDATLSLLSSSDCGENPTYMAFSPCGRYAYAVNEVDVGKVTSFAVEGEKKTLRKVGDSVSAGGNGPCHISASTTQVFAANYGSGHIAVCPVQADGSAAEPAQVLHPGFNAHMIVADAAGKLVYVPCLGSDHVVVYKLSNTPAAPLELVSTAQLHKGAGPRHIAFHPSKAIAYVLNELDLSITSFTVDAESGALSNPETLSCVPAGTSLKGMSNAHVAVTPDGRFVYASTRGPFSSVAIFKTNADSGRLLPCEDWERAGGAMARPRDFTLSPDGRFVLVANADTAEAMVFERDEKDDKGLLKLRSTIKTGVNRPSFIGWLA